MQDKCFMCSGNLIRTEESLICEECKVLIPLSKNFWVNETNAIVSLRNNLAQHLHALEENEISSPEKLTKSDFTEIELWKKHNDLFYFISYFIDKRISNEFKEKELYFYLYTYKKITDEIKQFYKNN